MVWAVIAGMIKLLPGVFKVHVADDTCTPVACRHGIFKLRFGGIKQAGAAFLQPSSGPPLAFKLGNPIELTAGEQHLPLPRSG